MVEQCRQGFEAWMNRNHIRTTTVLIVAIGMLLWVTWWSMKFASSQAWTGLDGAGAAAIIAAVQVPATYFAKWALATVERIMS